MASWKHYADSGVKPEMPLLNSKISFAVDASGSTAGRVMELEEQFVRGMVKGYDFPSSVIMWGSDVLPPIQVEEAAWRHRQWGTNPAIIFEDASVTRELKDCDMWYLLTDGEVGSPVNFARRTVEVGMANTPVVFVIVNRAGATPSKVDISVGISVFASAPDAAVVFKNTESGEMYVLAAKGAFETLVSGFELDLQNWESLPLFPDEAAFKMVLKDVNIVGAAHRPSSTAVDLGRLWQAKRGCLVDIDLLLAQTAPQSIPEDELVDLLEEETFDAFALLCKTRGILPTLRSWLVARKERASVIEIRDVSGAAEILQQLRDASGNPDNLRQKLRVAHQSNLSDYRTRISNTQPSPLVPFINRALARVNTLEKAGYAADILDRRSNRAMRAAAVNHAEVDQQLAALNLDDDVEAHRSTCSICCSDDVIMSLALKVPASPSDNTTDFALNFPLAAGAFAFNQDVISAQYVCFQCALAMYQMDPNRATMYNEAIAAVIPLAKYEGVNRKYITNCLATVLTGGLATGASGLVQLLMSIILTTMKTKEWAKAVGAETDEEIRARRAGMQWMVNNLVFNSSCRETFDETGDWVSFDRALQWTLQTFKDEGIYSWTVRYPVPGFLVLLELLGVVGAEIPETLRVLKLIHEVVTVYMARLIKRRTRREVQRDLLKMVFAEFNVEGVPKDLQDETLSVKAPEVGFEHFVAWFDSPETRELMEQVGQEGGAVKYGSALQYIAFKLSTEDTHQTPKGYLTRAAESDVHIHTATTVPQGLTPALVRPIFTSMLGAIPTAVDHTHPTADTIPLFVSPCGPSVLHCGVGGCPVRFDANGHYHETVRSARAAHFAQVYAIEGRKPQTANGLPENTGRLEAPTTSHATLHASIAKTWQALDKDKRRDVLKEVEPNELVDVSQPNIAAFVEAIMEHICLTSARGNIYNRDLGNNIIWVLPSFFTALHTAAVMKELDDDTEFELVETSLAARIDWELKLARM
ncbi:hypothetical protein FB45DRAFT_825902 [Roridomyces roridus]|uniref:Uncharacterized protein n=1 Tax=Roridomyces roridus TaxID=1738132 RepID=A0AAD7C7X7_9AGAR|nr:hypothetical protein FB45DRAFT_825902 [Roridomyces roridus]